MQRCNWSDATQGGVSRTRIRPAFRKRRSCSVKALLRTQLCFPAALRLGIDLPFGRCLSCFEAPGEPDRLVHVSEALGGAVRGLLQEDGTEEGRQRRGQGRYHGDSRSTQEEGQPAGLLAEQRDSGPGAEGQRRTAGGGATTMVEQDMEDHRQRGDSSTGRGNSYRMVGQQTVAGQPAAGGAAQRRQVSTPYTWHIRCSQPYTRPHPLYIDSRDFPRYYMENTCFTLDTPPSRVL